MSEMGDLQKLSIEELLALLQQGAQQIEFRRACIPTDYQKIRTAGKILKEPGALFETSAQEPLMLLFDKAVRVIYPRDKPWPVSEIEDLADREASHVREISYDYAMSVPQLDRGYNFCYRAWLSLRAAHQAGKLSKKA